MKDKITHVVSGIITLGSMLWSPLGGYVNAAGGQAEIIAAVLAVYTVVHGLVHYGHGKVAGTMVVLALLLPAPAMAQEPAPEPAPQFGALINFDTVSGSVNGLSGELDGSLEGWPVSMVAHVGHGPQGVRGAVGPRLTHDFGPVSILGHYLYGAVGVGPNAATNTLHRIGGALDVDIGRRGFVRWGVNRDHAGAASWSGVVGVGFRF